MWLVLLLHVIHPWTHLFHLFLKIIFILNVIGHLLSEWFVIGTSEFSVILHFDFRFCVICGRLREPVEYNSWFELLNLGKCMIDHQNLSSMGNLSSTIQTSFACYHIVIVCVHCDIYITFLIGMDQF